MVVIGRNEGKRLGVCLQSLKGLTKVVYADSASTDASVTLALENSVDVVVLDESKPLTAARGRNSGAQKLEGTGVEFLQFIDGDCELVPGWIEAATNWLDNNPSVAAVCGRRRERFPEASIYNKLADREWATPIGRTESTGGDALVRFEAFRNIQGFKDNQIAHEEPEFCSRLRSAGWKVWRIDQEMTIHDAATFRFSEFYRRSRRAGMGMVQAILRKNALADRASIAIIRRAVFWAVLLPLAIAGSALVDWTFSLLILSIYLIQWLRIFAKEYLGGKFSPREAAQVAALSIAGKFAETDGALRSILGHIRE